MALPELAEVFVAAGVDMNLEVYYPKGGQPKHMGVTDTAGLAGDFVVIGPPPVLRTHSG